MASILADLNATISQIPLEYLLWGHCLLVASWFPHLKDRFLLSYWVGLLGAVGGGVVSAYLLQDPKSAPNPIFSVNSVALIWSVSWWLINYFPGGLAASIVNLLPVRVIFKVAMNILRAGTIVSRVDAATRVYPGVWAAPLVLGTIGGTGGKFLVDGILGGTGLNPGTPELIKPTFAWRSGFLAALSYWLLVHVYGELTPGEGKALVVSVLAGHAVLSDLLGMPLDFTAPLAQVLHAVTLVPAGPGGDKALKPVKPVANGKGEGKKDK